jgi:hypothetical protein
MRTPRRVGTGCVTECRPRSGRGIYYREIARIVEQKYGYKTNHHTVKAFLERHPFPFSFL